MFKKLMLIAVVVVATAGLSGSALAVNTRTPKEKVNICHKTGSESNPWEAIPIADDALDTHLEHGDFLYEGPVNKNDKPVKKKGIGDKWCEDNIPTVPVDPVEPEEPEETTPRTLGTTTTAPQVDAPVGAVNAGVGGSATTALYGLGGSLATLGFGVSRIRRN